MPEPTEPTTPINPETAQPQQEQHKGEPTNGKPAAVAGEVAAAATEVVAEKPKPMSVRLHGEGASKAPALQEFFGEINVAMGNRRTANLETTRFPIDLPKATEFPPAQMDLPHSGVESRPSPELIHAREAVVRRLIGLFKVGMMRLRDSKGGEMGKFQLPLAGERHEHLSDDDIRDIEDYIWQLASPLDPNFDDAILDFNFGLIGLLGRLINYSNTYKDPVGAIRFLKLIAEPVPTDIDDDGRVSRSMDMTDVSWSGEKSEGKIYRIDLLGIGIEMLSISQNIQEFRREESGKQIKEITRKSGDASLAGKLKHLMNWLEKVASKNKPTTTYKGNKINMSAHQACLWQSRILTVINQLPKIDDSVYLDLLEIFGAHGVNGSAGNDEKVTIKVMNSNIETFVLRCNNRLLIDQLGGESRFDLGKRFILNNLLRAFDEFAFLTKLGNYERAQWSNVLLRNLNNTVGTPTEAVIEGMKELTKAISKLDEEGELKPLVERRGYLPSKAAAEAAGKVGTAINTFVQETLPALVKANPSMAQRPKKASAEEKV